MNTELVSTTANRLNCSPRISKAASFDNPKNKRIELYDLNNDPYEINNLADNSNYKLKVKDLYEELIILQKEMGDTLKLGMYFKNKL